MDYNTALKWINSYQKFGIKLELDRIRYILNELGNPQKKYKIIHIGGSNGKGSVCSYISSILNEAGFKVGTYTSPHLHDIKERFIVNNKKISKNDFAQITNNIKKIVDGISDENKIPTYFEIMTALSLQYFKLKNVDYAVVEVGLGGKYDATNIVTPIFTIITNISLEHQNILGKNISSIAEQKAGIIKENIPIFTAAKNNSLKIIKTIAENKKAPIFIIRKNNWTRTSNSLTYQEFTVRGLLNNYKIKTRLLGIYQGENIALSIQPVEYLQNLGFNIKNGHIKEGIEKTNNPGRMEVINNKPIIILDGAHNPKGFKVLFESLKNDFEYKKLIFIIGVLKDKNVKSMIPPMIRNSDYIITTQSNSKRALNYNDLKKTIINQKKDIKIASKENIRDAIKYALTLSSEKDLLCISGSLYNVAEARNYFKKNKKVLTINK